MGNLLDRIMGRETVPNLYLRITDDHVLTDNYTGSMLVKDQSYFEIRLTEMYLHRRQQLWQGVIPLGLAVADFLYDRRQERVPFFVGNQIMKNFESYIDGRFVEYRNTRVAGPIPYTGGDIGLFVGFFRLEVNNLVKGLFNLLDTMAGTFDISQISSYLKIAKPLGKELLPLLGMDEIGQCFAIRDELTDSSLREGYLVYGKRSQDTALAETLWINAEGRLMRGPDAGSLRDVDDFDHCVIQIRQRHERDDLTTLPFYESWIAAKKYIVEKELVKAADKFTETIRELALSSDLTEKHRHELILLYKTRFERNKELFAGITTIRRAASRGVAGAPNTAFALQGAARIAEKSGYDKNVWDGLMRLSADWQNIPEFEEKKAVSSGQIEEIRREEEAALHKQLQALREISPIEKPDPAALAQIITASTYSGM